MCRQEREKRKRKKEKGEEAGFGVLTMSVMHAWGGYCFEVLDKQDSVNFVELVHVIARIDV